ncbi:hypothetical protein [Luteitalea sp.]|uniref:hypothetical protein n=1 Tax=Luteitalea sp. TaxID=2004800 RepID=UPI0025C38941|nr:hypothetical protein [Luteitalea sp.]
MNSRHRLGTIALMAWTMGAPVLAQTSGPAVARITVADGIELELSVTGVRPNGRDLEPRVQVQDGDVYRMIVDGDGYARFAYALRLEARTGGVELLFRPVRLHEAMQAFAPRQRTYVSPFRLDSGLATFSDVQSSGTIRPGDSITLDLFEQRETGHRVGDVVKVTSVSVAGLARLAALRTRREDNRPVLTVAGMTIRRAGRVLNADRPGTLATAHAVGLGLGEKNGTVFFSAEPPQTEVPYGVATIDGRVLRFTLDGVEYECTGSEPVGPPGLSSVWMYVLREPLPYVKGFFVAGGDSVDVLMNPRRRQ